MTTMRDRRSHHDVASDDDHAPRATPVVPLSELAATLGKEPLSVTLIEETFDVAADAPFRALSERARRTRLMASLARAGALPAESAMNVVRASLDALGQSGAAANIAQLADIAAALRDAVDSLGVAPTSGRAAVVDTLVFDEGDVTRDLVALAVEANGHPVRCATTYQELVAELDARAPVLLFADVVLSNATPELFCRTLRELLYPRRVHLVLFSELDGKTLDGLARIAGARRYLSKTLGPDALLAQLRTIYRDILDTRSTGGRPKFMG